MTIVTLPTLDVTRLAADYSAAVRAGHTEFQLAAIRDRNAAETDPTIDHAHDYNDANDYMAAAIGQQLPSWNWTDHADAIQTAFDRAKAAEYRLSRVLVACEFSGTVRDAFTARGHSATSCDLLPTDTPGNHYRGDVRDILGDGWHMMIAHPPCRYLAASQLWRCQPKHDADYPARQQKSDEALDFVRDLMAAPIGQQAIENPVSRIGTAIRPASQYIQPYQFGHDHSKNTGLWLQNLPELVADPADYVKPRTIRYRGRLVKRWSNQSPCGADNTPPGPNRWRIRSKTFTGIAEAMADQWTGLKRAFPAAPARGQQMELFA